MDIEYVNVLLNQENPHEADLLSRYLGDANTFQFNLHAANQRPSGLNNLVNKYLEPENQGFETSQRYVTQLRQGQSDPYTHPILIVMLTSSHEECDIVESFQLGGNSNITYPVDLV